MPVEEIQQAGQGLVTQQTLDVLKYVLTALGLVVTNLITYFATRPKTKSEVDKNLADTHKSEADAVKTRVETIAMLLNEVDEMLVTTKLLRTEIQVRVKERVEALAIIKKMIHEAEELIDLAVTVGAVQVVRMKAVMILERLHKLRDLLEVKEV